MKTAIYIDDGVLQVVLTPQTETDRKVLDVLEESDGEMKISRGQFYDCQGGYFREGWPSNFAKETNLSNHALIVRIEKIKSE